MTTPVAPPVEAGRTYWIRGSTGIRAVVVTSVKGTIAEFERCGAAGSCNVARLHLEYKHAEADTPPGDKDQ